MFKAKVEANFNDEKSFKFFQKEFAKCIGHFKVQAGAEATLKNLTKVGTYKWNFDAESKVECSGLLKFVNLSIKKTFEGGNLKDDLALAEDVPDYEPCGEYVSDMLATIELTTSNYSTRLVACGR